MNPIINFATQMIMNNPQIANNPQFQNYIRVIQSGNNAQGEQLARNLCSTYGVSPEDGLKQARQFFHI